MPLGRLSGARCYRSGVRIAHVVPRGEQPWSGVLTVIVHLAAALARRGHHVEVWQLHDWDPARYSEQRTRLAVDGVDEVRVPATRRLGHASRSLADRRAVDVVHLHGAFNPSNTAVSRALGRPYVFSPHSGYDPVSLRRSSLRKRAYTLLFERAMLRRAALVVALTGVELEHCRRFGATGPLEVIPNGVAPPPGDLERTRFRAELGLDDDVPLAVFVGRLDVHRKGLDVLVDGFAHARPWHVALVGPAFRDVDQLERRVAELRLTDRVHLLGERHGRPVLEAMASADVFTLLSRWEGLPMSLLEALSVGTPAIVSRAVERVVGVQASGAGWAVEPNQLAGLLRELDHPARREIRSRRTAASALARRFDWEEVAERYERAYGIALAGRRSG
jgi:glycosyltransferase involved in cell wall biosynthesis